MRKATISILTLLSLAAPAAMSQCGDCNEDGQVSTVLDALAAARIDAGVISATRFQRVYCDVNASRTVDVLDALLIAQYSAGLPVQYMCQMEVFPLGAAGTFGTFGGSAGVTNQGVLTVINGDIGSTAVSTAVTGFHDSTPGCIYTETPLNIGTVNGLIFTAPPPPTVACPDEGTAITLAVAMQARMDALALYDALVAFPPGSDPGAGDLSNLVLAPGVYTAAAGSFILTGGDLTLDAQGDPNASWVFQMATSLTVGDPAMSRSILLINMANANNVAWQVGSAATINPAGGGTMVGTIISQSGAAISTPGIVDVVTIDGRVLSLNASVTMVNTVVNVPNP